jgi:hypothetical protein
MLRSLYNTRNVIVVTEGDESMLFVVDKMYKNLQSGNLKET